MQPTKEEQPKEALKELMRCFNWHNGYTNEDRDGFYAIVNKSVNSYEELKQQNAELLADQARLNFLIADETSYFVRWIKNPNKPIKYRVASDGEDITGWHPTARLAIDAAMRKATS